MLMILDFPFSRAQRTTIIRPPDKRPRASNLIHATQKKKALQKTLLATVGVYFGQHGPSRRVRHRIQGTGTRLSHRGRSQRRALPLQLQLQLLSWNFKPQDLLHSLVNIKLKTSPQDIPWFAMSQNSGRDYNYYNPK